MLTAKLLSPTEWVFSIISGYTLLLFLKEKGSDLFKI